MTDAKLHKILDSMNVPREVWIGTDSVADRLEWLKRRKEMLEANIKSTTESSPDKLPE